MIFPFKNAAFILDQLISHGFEAYVVGGAVRDYLLGRPIHDIDVATSAHPADVVSLFKRTIPIGIEHGTVAVLSHGSTYEVTTFRSETGYDDFRHPSQVAFVSSLEQDLMRRDFTINALAMDRAGIIIDLFGGQSDIIKQRIRTVGKAEERISEDPLRMMRGMRFASELCFTLGQTECEAFYQKAELLKNISVERINQEMTRLLAGKGVANALILLFETGCIHKLPMLEHAGPVTNANTPRYWILQSDEERWTAFLISVGIDDVHAFAKAWKWSKNVRQSVVRLTALLKQRLKNEWTRETVYFAGTNDAKAADRLLAALGTLHENDLASCERQVEFLWNTCPIHSRSELTVTGNQFMNWSDLLPGPWLAEVIQDLERDVVNGRIENKLEVIRSWFKKWQITQKKQS
ncbi:CCA tRNA nucleotidyltransferase [Sporolactobacillus sp. STCC-11]|uniref:CCA tRNA nucleotidyltransferase n=1 Tax=Sporolactobacillus caesalpiniae TaxID=3230362 RepID=UPI0033989748